MDSAALKNKLLLLARDFSWMQLAFVGAGTFAAGSLVNAVYGYWYKSRSPLRAIPGPRAGASYIYGHFLTMLDSENNSTQERWVKEYGETYTFRGFFGAYELVTTDLRAMTHVLFASQIFRKRETERTMIKYAVGEGILYTDSEQHKNQRRLLNPAFGFSQVRDMTPVFLEKGAQLREIWYNKCIEAGGSARLNAFGWLSKATLDAIGKAGFDYDFGTLNETGRTNELADSFDRAFRTDLTPLEEIRFMLSSYSRIVRVLAPGERAQASYDNKRKMIETGTRIVQEKKAAILAELGGSTDIGRKAVGGKDLISLLLQSNLAADVDPLQRLSDEEVVAQIPTFLLAGHETTSTSTTWAMYALSQNPEVQKKLRDELLAVPTDTPTLDALNALPYLDQVTREVLRLHAVVSFLLREVSSDDMIPLGNPIVDGKGRTITHIKVQKGDQVMIPIWLINHSKSIWGPDADKFRPERWENPPAEALGIPGIAPNLMSFIGGPRSCIGFRFAIAEMKALLFHIVRGFEFKLAVDPSELFIRTAFLMKPQLRGSNSVELPVTLTPVA